MDLLEPDAQDTDGRLAARTLDRHFRGGVERKIEDLTKPIKFEETFEFTSYAYYPILKDELAKRAVADAGTKTDAQPPKSDSAKQDDAGPGKAGAEKGNRIELQLPDDRDIDRVIGFLERAWRRLIEAANRMQRDVSGKI